VVEFRKLFYLKTIGTSKTIFASLQEKFLIILAFLVDSKVEVDILKIRLECSYKPSAEEISKRRY
jgi:hypothetical protein